jgi:Transketolase, N-terminal subunit
MALIDSKTGKHIREFNVVQLEKEANLMRGYNLVALRAAGSGHSGGTLSIMDIAAALYLKIADHDPRNPEWPDRDRVIWSTGHKAPALYVALGVAGFCPLDDVVTLRKLSSPFQGHPHWLKLPGVEASTGSLGQGLSIAIGMALAGKLNKKNYSVFTIMGDGEQQEGQVWEAAMEAGHYKLDNLCAIVDCNRLQIDGKVSEVMGVAPLADKYRSFGWEVVEVNGHDMNQVVLALEMGKRNQFHKPLCILADTVKGKGVSFMEDVAGWHGKTPNHEELLKALAELGLTEKIPVDDLLRRAAAYQVEVDRKLNDKMPKFSRDYWWNRSLTMTTDMKPTRMGSANRWPRTARTSASFASASTSPARSPSASSTTSFPNARRAG